MCKVLAGGRAFKDLDDRLNRGQVFFGLGCKESFCWWFVFFPFSFLEGHPIDHF